MKREYVLCAIRKELSSILSEEKQTAYNMLSLVKMEEIFVSSCMDIKCRMIHKKLVTVVGQREVREPSDWDEERGIIFTE